MVDLSLRIYHHFHDNLDAFAEKAAVFRAILVSLHNSAGSPAFRKNTS